MNPPSATPPSPPGMQFQLPHLSPGPETSRPPKKRLRAAGHALPTVAELPATTIGVSSPFSPTSPIRLASPSSSPSSSPSPSARKRRHRPPLPPGHVVLDLEALTYYPAVESSLGEEDGHGNRDGNLFEHPGLSDSSSVGMRVRRASGSSAHHRKRSDADMKKAIRRIAKERRRKRRTAL